jgi:hypothetical protein
MAEGKPQTDDTEALPGELRRKGTDSIERLRSMVEDLKAVQEHEARVLDSDLTSKAFNKTAGN